MQSQGISSAALTTGPFAVTNCRSRSYTPQSNPTQRADIPAHLWELLPKGKAEHMGANHFWDVLHPTHSNAVFMATIKTPNPPLNH